jgi:hypothetical protein
MIPEFDPYDMLLDHAEHLNKLYDIIEQQNQLILQHAIALNKIMLMLLEQNK